MSGATWLERFQAYFDRPVAQAAAKSLTDSAEIELKITSADATETLTFGKSGGRNRVSAGAPRSPQVTFTIPAPAAEQILADASDDIGQIGVNIAKMIMAGDKDKKIGFKLHSGFLGLFSKGYLGVVTAGGGGFASFLASKGLNGVSGIKAALKKLKAD